MSGGHSLHGKDWLKIAAAAAATAATAGMAAPLFAGTAAAGAGAGLLGGAAADTAAAGLGGGTAALFGPTAGGSALAAEGSIPFITGGGAAGMGGGTASLFGGAGLPAADIGGMFTAGLGEGAGGASMPTFADKINSGLSNMLPGGNDTLSSLKSGLSKVARAQNAYQKASGLLGPQQAPTAPPPMDPARFGQGASPSNLASYMNQPNSMMPSQGQGQLTPEMLALLLKMQQGGLYG